MSVGAVIIGRNEGERLARCIESVLAGGTGVEAAVYVDSGSRDSSVERARALGATVVELRVGPFTAARGRDEGVRRLSQDRADIDRVLFIDGDCVLDPGFVRAASAVLDTNERVAAVCARRREARTRESFWSRVVDIDWDIPPGDVAYFGGDSLVRLAALRDAGGWPTDLIAGEEPDLCFRMADRGWRIARIPGEMTRHDIAMRGYRAYWRRGVRSGHAYAEVGWRRRAGAGRAWLRRAASIVLYGLVAPVALALGWLAHWSVSALAALLLARVGASMVMSCRRKGRGWGLSLAYAALNTLGKSAGAWGIARFVALRAIGRRSRIIEYKPVEGSATGGAA